MYFIPLFFSFFFLFSPPAHPVHVALTSIDYQADRQEFNVSFKIFYDDLQFIIAEKYNVALKLDKPDENPDEKTYLGKYISENFKFIVNGNRKLVPEFTGKNINEKAIWLYYRIPCSSPVRQVYIYNTVMMDMYGDQTDLLIFKYGKFEKGVSLNSKHYEVRLNIK